MTIINRTFFIFIICLFNVSVFSQHIHNHFDHQDTLRGTITPERSWWDLTYYHLDIKVNPKERTLKGTNKVVYKVLENYSELQIDLQAPMQIDKVEQKGKLLNVKKDGNAHFIHIPKKQKIGSNHELIIHFSGQPKVSAKPPWDGGLTWQKDTNGNDFIVTTCQGDGASLWWPCKDHMYDEPDSMLISVTIPENLMDVSNGRLRGVDNNKDGTKTYHWGVVNPINNYGVNLNIGDYVHFSEVYKGEKGDLDCNYYVLRDNEKIAKEYFKEVPRMLEAFEHWFGPYPFYEDAYKLVEVPYPGMEHQSSVTYGNKYKPGYLGRDVSFSGWGFKFDFIIIHESGHEWFANSITYKDIADMWIHESFTAYSENLFVDYHFGKEASEEYVIGTRANIRNDRPIIGPYNVNKAGSGDMYYKGANVIHNIRQLVNDDEKWRTILRDLNKTFYHQTVSTEQIENYLSEQIGRDLNPFFDQYLRDVRIPILEYVCRNEQLFYRWSNVVPEFDMPIKVKIGNKEEWINPTIDWNTLSIGADIKTIKVDRNFYVASLNLTN